MQMVTKCQLKSEDKMIVIVLFTRVTPLQKMYLEFTGFFKWSFFKGFFSINIASFYFKESLFVHCIAIIRLL